MESDLTKQTNFTIFMDMVRIYTIKDCAFCDEMKKHLTESKINFVEVDVEDNRNKREFDKLVEISKADSVPILLVNNKILVPNRSFKTIKEGFEITKKILSNG